MVIALFFQFLAHYFDVYDLEEGCLQWIELLIYVFHRNIFHIFFEIYSGCSTIKYNVKSEPMIP